MDPYKLIINAFDSQASAYQDKFMYLDLYDATYIAFCDQIQKNDARILEIGCGPGNITRFVIARKPGFRIEGIDLAPNMVALAARNNPNARFSVMDCREIDRLRGPFDAIVCGFCMPYLSREECRKLFRDCFLLLETEGVLYFSCIEGDYTRSGYLTNQAGEKNFFTYYHDQTWLDQLCLETGFGPAGFWRIPYPEKDGSDSHHLVFLVKKAVR
jgi:trans-aconitate methyltransferase